MRIRDFLLAVYDALTPHLPERLHAHDWRVRFSSLQVYFGDPAVHYEVWVQKRQRRIEIGLHFECAREVSYGWADALAPRALEIQSQLGAGVELEEWTESWTRLHETCPFERDLTQPLAEQVAARLARFIEVLEPIRAETQPAPAR